MFNVPLKLLTLTGEVGFPIVVTNSEMILQTNTDLPLNIDANLKMMIHVGAVSIEPLNIMLEANKQVRTDSTMFDMRIADFF